MCCCSIAVRARRRLTAAGAELLREGRRLLQQIDAVAHRVQRVATGWEPSLTIAVDNILAPRAVFDLIEAFLSLRCSDQAEAGPLPTRLKLRTEVMTGTLEALSSGQADLAIGVPVTGGLPQGLRSELIGRLPMLMAVAPHHPLAEASEPLSAQTLAQHRVIAIADTAQRMDRSTRNHGDLVHGNPALGDILAQAFADGGDLIGTCAGRGFPWPGWPGSAGCLRWWCRDRPRRLPRRRGFHRRPECPAGGRP